MKRRSGVSLEKTVPASSQPVAKKVKTNTGSNSAAPPKLAIEEAENDDEEEDSEIKWRYLEHHGVLFPDYWNKHNVKAKYEGKPIELSLI